MNRTPAFRHVLDQAAEEVDFDLKEVSFQDRQGILNETRYTQPCMVAFAAGLTAVLEERGVAPAVAAGLSLGEYSALHAAGVFDARTAVGLTAFRGRAMEEAAAGRESAMMAVLGMGRELLQAACDEAAALGCVTIANYNCPGQLVIGGERAAVEQAAALAKEKGAKRCLPLNVSGPFHTPLMAPAGEALREYFKELTLQPPIRWCSTVWETRRGARRFRSCWCARSRAASGWRTPSGVWPPWAWTPWWRSVRARLSVVLSARPRRNCG